MPVALNFRPRPTAVKVVTKYTKRSVERTVRFPDDKCNRLKEFARQRGTSVNRLVDEMATMLMAEFDAETRFKVRASRGQDRQNRGLDLLEKAAGSKAPVLGQKESR